MAPPGVKSLPGPNPVPFNLDKPYKIPAGEYYVMGDNRTDSEDSRCFGPIPKSLIVGRASSGSGPSPACGLYRAARPAPGTPAQPMAAMVFEGAPVHLTLVPFLSPAKLLVILVVALVVLGPDKLPRVAKQIGATVG